MTAIDSNEPSRLSGAGAASWPPRGLRGRDLDCRPAVRTLAREVLTQIGDKWTTQVISALSHGPLRFGELEAAVPGISHRMLTRTVRSLERDGLLTRTVHAEVPPRVEYELTALGETLIVPIAGILDWVGVHQEEVAANREAFER
jgi:DNA-binding HxlR family transcriptional regulator